MIFSCSDMSDERVSIFIDGSNFYHSTKNILIQGYKIPFQELIDELVKNRKLINVFYYIAKLDPGINYKKYQKHQKFLNVLRTLPKLNVILCNLEKVKIEDGSFRYIVKGDDIQLAHDLLIGAVDDFYDIAIIVSGDADFIPVIKTVRERFKKKIGNAYFRRTSSYKLRKACDFSVNLYKVIFKILNKK